MTYTTYQAAKIVICHGPDAVHFVNCLPGTVLSTGQPQVEEFDAPLEAIQRYITLGGAAGDTSSVWPKGQLYNPITKAFADLPAEVPTWTADGSYPLHAVVMHNGKRWLHISEQQNEPDEIYDIEAGTGDWCPC